MFALDWNLFEDDERYEASNLEGMEAQLPDGTMLDVLRYRDSDEWCWMVRTWEEGASSYSISASYDDGAWYATAEEAYDGLVAYIDCVAPDILGVFDRKKDRSSFAERAAAFGFAAVLALSMVAAPVFASTEQAVAAEEAVQVLVINQEPAKTPQPYDVELVTVDSYADLALGTVYDADGAELEMAGEVLSGYPAETVLARTEGQYGFVTFTHESGMTVTVEDEDFYAYVASVQEETGTEAVIVHAVQVDPEGFAAMHAAVEEGTAAGSVSGDALAISMLAVMGGACVPVIVTAVRDVRDSI